MKQYLPKKTTEDSHSFRLLAWHVESREATYDTRIHIVYTMHIVKERENAGTGCIIAILLLNIKRNMVVI